MERQAFRYVHMQCGIFGGGARPLPQVYADGSASLFRVSARPVESGGKRAHSILGKAAGGGGVSVSVRSIDAKEQQAENTEKENEYQLKVSGEEQANALLRDLIDNGAPIITFDLREPSLHEIFVEKVGDAHED